MGLEQHMEARAAGVPTAVHGRHYFGIFAVACAILAYQILITRFFSVMLFYHFAFAAISLAMLGLTAGAMSVHRHRARYSAERVNVEFGLHAAWFAASSVGVVIVFLCAPLICGRRPCLRSCAVMAVALVRRPSVTEALTGAG